MSDDVICLKHDLPPLSKYPRNLQIKFILELAKEQHNPDWDQLTQAMYEAGGISKDFRDLRHILEEKKGITRLEALFELKHLDFLDKVRKSTLH